MDKYYAESGNKDNGTKLVCQCESAEEAALKLVKKSIVENTTISIIVTVNSFGFCSDILELGLDSETDIFLTSDLLDSLAGEYEEGSDQWCCFTEASASFINAETDVIENNVEGVDLLCKILNS